MVGASMTELRIPAGGRLPEMSVCKGSSGAGLEVVFEGIGFLLVLKRYQNHQLPRLVLGGVRRLTRIMSRQPDGDILCDPNVTLLWTGFTLDQIDEFHKDKISAGAKLADKAQHKRKLEKTEKGTLLCKYFGKVEGASLTALQLRRAAFAWFSNRRKASLRLVF
jgi:hypothetical protein